MTGGVVSDGASTDGRRNVELNLTFDAWPPDRQLPLREKESTSPLNRAVW